MKIGFIFLEPVSRANNGSSGRNLLVGIIVLENSVLIFGVHEEFQWALLWNN